MENKIRDFIQKSLGANRQLNNDTSLFAGGILDSLDHARLINFLETEFGLSLSTSDLKIENFDSIAKIAQFVEQKQRRV